MFNLIEELEELSMSCFAIEKKLPSFAMRSETTEAMEFRRRLFRLRIEIGDAIEYAKHQKIEYES